jgi:hypothetical protein
MYFGRRFYSNWDRIKTVESEFGDLIFSICNNIYFHAYSSLNSNIYVPSHALGQERWYSRCHEEF